MGVRILHGDCVKVMATLAEASVDSIVTDPPYHLTQASRGGHARTNSPTMPHGRHRIGDKGFMGQVWDGGDVAFRVETWATALRVLKPGGHLLAFSGTRTYHRMVCAIEDAGFEIRDQIGWAYGSGFPKSHNGPWGGTALKPAWEPICVARKPLAGTVEANWREHGTGALNIDGCRVGDTVETWPATRSFQAGIGKGYTEGKGAGETQSTGAAPAGRWPANLIHDGSDEVLAAFPQAPGQSGTVTGDEPSSKTNAVYGAFNGRPASSPRGDTGSAARFFYCAKADRADRNDGGANNTHPTVKPTDLMRYLCRLVTPAGGMVLDPFMGSGSTLKAAELEGFSAIGIELDPAYIEIARRRIASDAPLFAEVA